MEDAEKGEKGDKESPPLQIDPKWYVRQAMLTGSLTMSGRSFQDALRAFFQPIKTDDPRLDFYTMYKREATEYDVDYVKKYDEDLNTTLIFVRRSSCTPTNHLTCCRRRVCSLPSAQPSLSMSIQNFGPTPTNNP